MAHLLRRIIKTIHPCIVLTASFAGSRNIAFDKTSGIRAAAQRIISAMDGGAYMQHRVCYNKLDVQKYTRTYIFERASALFSANSLYLHHLFSKALARINCRLVISFCPLLVEFFPVSEAARMPLIPRRNKIALQTCSSRMYTDVHFKTAKDGSGSTQKRVRLRTRSPKMNKDVHFWARVFSKNNNFIVYKARNIVDNVHIHDVIEPYIFYLP